MPTTEQQLAEHDYRAFYLSVRGEPADWLSGTDPVGGDSAPVGRTEFLDAFLALHPDHAAHREFLAFTMPDHSTFPVSRAAWVRVVGSEDALAPRPDAQLTVSRIDIPRRDT